MLKVKVISAEVIERNVTPRTGAAFVAREQEALIFTHTREGRISPHGVPMVLSLKDREAYPVGNYWLSMGSIYVNRWGQLEIAPVLVLQQEERKAA